MGLLSRIAGIGAGGGGGGGAKSGTSPEDLVHRAVALIGRGEARAAVKVLDEALKADPGSAEALYRKGLALNILGRYSDAITCFDGVLAAAPTGVGGAGGKGDAAAHNNRAIALAELGDTESALAGYERAVEADPSYAAARFNLGVLRDRLGDRGGALAELDEAARLDPAGAAPQFYRGIVLGKMGRHEEALNCFEGVCSRHPGHDDAQFHRGIELAETGRHGDALAAFDRLLGRRGPSASLLYARARSLAAQGRPGQAAESLGRAYRMDKKTIRAWARGEKEFERYAGDERFASVLG